MNLGELIIALKALPASDYLSIDNSPVDLYPIKLTSYRGYYEDIAITCETGRSSTQVSSLLNEAEEALRHYFTGYKGGEFEMSHHTRVWISNYGEASGALLTGIRSTTYGYHFLTWKKEED